MKKLIFTSLVLILAIGYYLLRSPSDSKNNEVEGLYELSESQQIQKLQHSLVQIDPQAPIQRLRPAFETLAAGLKSSSSDVRESAAALVRSLLIDVGHGEVEVPENVRRDLDALFRILADANTEQIREMREANPGSPALAYLDQLNK